MTDWRIIHGDCVEAMRELDDASVHAVVTDPPYSIDFMAAAWDTHDDEDAAFGYYMAGLIDGEGHFRVDAKARRCEFSMKLRDDDEWILGRLRSFIGHGRIAYESPRNGSAPQARLVIDTKPGVAALCALLMRYPLRAKKLRDFLTWAEAVDEWLTMERGNRWHGPADRARLSELGRRIREGRTYSEVAWSGNGFQDWCRAWATECLRVLMPGGHLLAFGSSRTFHRLATGVEDAGFEVRDTIMWLYGSGFPKSLNVAKAIGRAQGGPIDQTVPSAEPWEGWGTALKPSHEPVLVARKPLDGTVAANVLAHGAGALNVDGCRVPMSDEDRAKIESMGGFGRAGYDGGPGRSLSGSVDGTLGWEDDAQAHPEGRWPTNVLLGHGESCADECAPGCPVAVLGDQSGVSRSAEPGSVVQRATNDDLHAARRVLGRDQRQPGNVSITYGDEGTAARFFPRFRYSAKASSAERDAGLAHLDLRHVGKMQGAIGRDLADAGEGQGRNDHPTVKPIDLMRWLIRLVVPPGGVVLDPFTGSGTTGCAAVLEDVGFIGCERESDYVGLASNRIAWWAERPPGTEVSDAVRSAARSARDHDDQRDRGQLGLLDFLQ